MSEHILARGTGKGTLRCVTATRHPSVHRLGTCVTVG